jgi:hypothetical protein
VSMNHVCPRCEDLEQEITDLEAKLRQSASVENEICENIARQVGNGISGVATAIANAIRDRRDIHRRSS